MKGQSKRFVLKSGLSVDLHIPKLDEAQKLLDLKRSYINNTSTIPLTLEEYPNDVFKEQKIIRTYQNSSNSVLFVVSYNGEFIGNIDLTGSTRSKMAHTAMIGMGVKTQWRGQGVGSLLLQSALDWAKEHSTLKLIWLDVYASNDAGIKLYKNMGFQVSGVVKNFFKEENGYEDKIQMYLNVEAK